MPSEFRQTSIALRGDLARGRRGLLVLAAVVALLVANVFYDYILRTFVWVIAALAVCVARIHGAPRGEAVA
jgi:hypothetical protein